MELLLIDAIAPFFRNTGGKRVNWSKIPFTEFENAGGLLPENRQRLLDDFYRLTARVAGMGYNSVTLDDVARLCPCLDYPCELNEKISSYLLLYRELIAIAGAAGLKVFITTDIMFYHVSLRKKLGGKVVASARWLGQQLEELFRHLPQLAGVIFRFGEADGAGVSDDFPSRLLLRTPAQARKFLSVLLPYFEKVDKKLLFRTWSIGAYSIGDLMWNPQTFDKVFSRVDSPALVISMKYGESDFFRYLPVNPLFFHSRHKKIVEFQARREYEGFGTYPSFVGFDCEEVLGKLKDAPGMVGMSVWCQTGGWGKNRRLSFVRKSSPWVELNCHVMASLFRGVGCRQAVEDYRAGHIPEADSNKWLEFLQLSDRVIKDLLYVREFAGKPYYFRRLRLPPTLFVFWDRVMVSRDIGNILNCLVHDKSACIEQGAQALDNIRHMRELTASGNIPDDGLEYQEATFEILQTVREYYFSDYHEESARKLEELKEAYRQRFSRRYSIRIDMAPPKLGRAALRRVLPLFLRGGAAYRRVDRFLLLWGMSLVYPLLKLWKGKLIPDFTRKQTMGMDVFFK